MVAVRQSKKEIVFSQPLTGLAISYDGKPRVDATACETGLDEAYRKGYDEASSHFNQQIVEFRNEVNALREGTFSTLEAKYQKIVTEAREALMALTYGCVQQVLGGLKFTPEMISSIVESVIEESGLDEETIEIRMTPADIDLLADLEKDIKARHPGLTFVPDTTLMRGDCLLSSRFGKVDGLIATKIQRLKESLQPEL